MLILIVMFYIFGLYVSALYIYIKHKYYLKSLFSRTRHIEHSSDILSRHRSLHARVAPMYRKEYFGYEYFVLPDLNNKILYPDHKLRVYGVVRPYCDCLVWYKGDTVKTVVCLDDKRYGDNVLEEFRKTYRNIIILISGGVLLWFISLGF